MNNSTLNAGQTVWAAGGYITPNQMTGLSNQIQRPSFKAGDLIFCYIVDNGWGSGIPLGTPIPSHIGIFNVTLYLKF
jgi:cell wall-associated NlpC family hydrolase